MTQFLQAVVATKWLIAALLLNLLGCYPKGELISFGPEVEANLVVLFHPDASSSEIAEFVATTIGRPHPGGGHQHLPGIMSVLKVRVGECHGYAIRYHESATAAEKTLVRQQALGSSMVKGVVENAVPAEIAPCPAV